VSPHPTTGGGSYIRGHTSADRSLLPRNSAGSEVLSGALRRVSQNVGPNFESGRSGMGLRFLEMKSEVARKVEGLYERKLKEAAERES